LIMTEQPDSDDADAPYSSTTSGNGSSGSQAEGLLDGSCSDSSAGAGQLRHQLDKQQLLLGAEAAGTDTDLSREIAEALAAAEAAAGERGVADRQASDKGVSQEIAEALAAAEAAADAAVAAGNTGSPAAAAAAAQPV
jgi:hypothetical protein